MSATIPRFAFCVVLVASLAGCGGSNGGSGGCGSNCGGGGGNPTTVTYAFSGATPTAVATKIGTGAYTQATLASGNLSISLPSGTTNYSVAWLCPPDSRAGMPVNDENVIQASVQDGTSFSYYCYDPNVTMGAATLQVDASAIAGAWWVEASGGVEDNGGSIYQPWSSGTLNLSGQMLAGTYDVFVYVQDMQYNLLAVRILRKQTIPGALNGGNPVVFAASDLTGPESMTVENLPTGFSFFYSWAYYETSTPGDALGLNTYGSQQYKALPSDTMQAGDYYWFDVGACGSSSNVTECVNVDADTTAGGPQTFTLPAPWSYAGPSPAALPTFNFDYSGFSGMTDVQQQAGIEWGTGNVSGNEISPENWIQISATANYQNGATSITVPDLSGMAGFIAPAPSGTSVYWSAEVEQGFALLSSPTSGTLSTVGNAGSYTEP